MKKQIYGVSSKSEFGSWSHNVVKFENEEQSEKWLKTEEYDFREREIMSKRDAIKLAGAKAVENASDYETAKSCNDSSSLYVSYSLFSNLYIEAKEYDDIDMYVAERGWQDWMDQYDMQTVVAILNITYSLSKLDFRDIRTRSNLSMAEFSDKYKVPQRTIENWCSEARVANEHTIMLIAYTMLIEELHCGND